MCSTWFFFLVKIWWWTVMVSYSCLTNHFLQGSRILKVWCRMLFWHDRSLLKAVVTDVFYFVDLHATTIYTVSHTYCLQMTCNNTGLFLKWHYTAFSLGVIFYCERWIFLNMINNVFFFSFPWLTFIFTGKVWQSESLKKQKAYQ